jgi:uncharacterized Fe-S center protein
MGLIFGLMNQATTVLLANWTQKLLQHKNKTLPIKSNRQPPRAMIALQKNMKPLVHFIPIDKIRALAQALDTARLADVVKKNDFVAIKIHFGEKGNKGYVKPENIKPLIKAIKDLGAFPFVTDANTIYKGERTDAVHHLMVAAEHNFHPKFLGCPVIIADGLRGNNFVEVNIGLKHFKKVKVAEAIYNADAIVSVAHFKGHELCGIGGAIKNLGMGCASRQGKYEQHCTVVPKINAAKCTACGACVKWCAGGALSLSSKFGVPKFEVCNPELRTSNSGLQKISFNPLKCTGCGQCILACNFHVFSLPWDEGAGIVQEKIAEYAAGVLKGKRAFYINFLNHITQFCDCFGARREKPLLPDIGILLSHDPVAIDQTCMDLIEKHAGRDILKEATGMDGNRQIEHAEELGLGSRDYQK